MDGKFRSREEFLADVFKSRPLISENQYRIPNKFNAYCHNDVENTLVDRLEFDKRLNRWNFLRVEMNFVEIFNEKINSFGIQEATLVYPYGFKSNVMYIREMKSDPKIHIPRKDKTNA